MKQGWEVKRLDDVCEFRNGLWTGKKPPFQTVGVIRNTNFTKDGRLDDNDIVYLEVESSQFSKRKLQYGDIILEKSGGGPKQPVGRVIVFDKEEGDFSFSNFTSVIRISNKNTVDFNYLHRFLFFSYISGATETMQSHSTGIRNLKFDDYKAIQIPLPPLPEQKRIVAILDEAFAAITQAKANAEQNLKNAKELFESYLQSVFENKGEGWEERTLGEVCKVERGSSPRPIDKYFTNEDDGVNWIKIGDTKGVDRYIYTTKQKITKEGALKSRLVEVDDFILSNSMSFGKPYIMKTQGYIHDGWFVLRLPKDIDTEFFWYLLASPYTMNQFISLAAGAIVKNISGDLVKRTVLPIPPLKEQQTIVQKLDALSTETKQLESIYQQKINDLDELKKSILQKAFAGELNTTALVV